MSIFALLFCFCARMDCFWREIRAGFLGPKLIECPDQRAVIYFGRRSPLPSPCFHATRTNAGWRCDLHKLTLCSPLFSLIFGLALREGQMCFGCVGFEAEKSATAMRKLCLNMFHALRIVSFLRFYCISFVL